MAFTDEQVVAAALELVALLPPEAFIFRTPKQVAALVLAAADGATPNG